MVEDNKHEIHDEQETAILDIPKEENADQAGLPGLNEQPVDEQAADTQARYMQLPYWRKVAAVLVIFVILVLLFLGGRAIYHHYHKTNPNVGTGGQAPAQPNGESTGGNTSGNKGSSSTGAGTGAGTATGNGTGTGNSPAGAQVGKSGELPNSGPGDVLAIFTGTSLAAAGIHYVVTGRRAKDQD